MSVTPADRVIVVLQGLALDPDRYFIGGSGPMALRNMRHVGDLDIGVTTAYWFELLDSQRWKVVTPDEGDEIRRCDPPHLSRRVLDIDVHVFSSWRRRVVDTMEVATTDYNQIFRNGIETVKGWPCMKLEILLKLKADHLRDKDIPDVAVIARQIELDGLRRDRA